MKMRSNATRGILRAAPGSALCFLLLLLTACGGAGSGPEADNTSSANGVSEGVPSSSSDDSAPFTATDSAPVATSDTEPDQVPEPGSNTIASDPGTAAPESTNPDVLTADLATRRVYVPGRGWLTEEAFWDVYYNNPADLPNGPDFDALNKLGFHMPPPAASANE